MFVCCCFCYYDLDIENLEYDEVKKRNTLIDLVTNEAYREPFQ